MLLKEIKEVRKFVKLWRKEGFIVGYVLIMGVFYEGYESLIKRVVVENDRVIVFVFVNLI